MNQNVFRIRRLSLCNNRSIIIVVSLRRMTGLPKMSVVNEHLLTKLMFFIVIVLYICMCV